MELPCSLLLGTAAVLGVTAVLAFRAVGHPTSANPSRAPIPPEVPVSWGYKCFWLAVRGADTSLVVRALDLKDARPSGWEEGIDAAYRKAYFVTPSVDGWVFVVSTNLPDAGGPRHPNKIGPFIKQLSQQLDCEVQYFGTHRIVDYHAWMRAANGTITRGFAIVEGELLMNEGEPTEPEVELKLAFKDQADLDNSERSVDEEDVLTVAGKWSINPATFDDYGRKVGLGVLGSANS